MLFVIETQPNLVYEFSVPYLSGHCASVSTPPLSRVSDDDGGLVLQSQSSGHGHQLSDT
jgi:hypothetical protein